MASSASRRGAQISESNGENAKKGPHKIAFIPDDLLSSGSIRLMKLRNPHTDAGTIYVLDKDKKTLLEIISFDDGNRSWFLGHTVESNGKLHIISPVDVTYLILPYLMKSSRVVPLDHLLEDTQFPDVSCLDSVMTHKDLSHVADRIGSPDLCAWKYNEEKALTWLSSRVAQLASLLEEKKVPTSTAQSLTFVKPMDPQQAREAYMGLAHGIIAEYLSENLSSRLHKHLKLPDKKIKPKVTNGAENVPPKKLKTSGPTEDYSQDNVGAVKVETPKTAKEKALAKSAQGSKSITSFFMRK